MINELYIFSGGMACGSLLTFHFMNRYLEKMMSESEPEVESEQYLSGEGVTSK